MPYRIPDSRWLSVMADRIQGILLQHLERGRAYTVAELKALFLSYGFDFDNDTLIQLRDILISRGVIEAV